MSEGRMSDPVQPNPSDELVNLYGRAFGAAMDRGVTGYAEWVRAGLAAVLARVSAPTPNHDGLRQAREAIAKARSFNGQVIGESPAEEGSPQSYRDWGIQHGLTLAIETIDKLLAGVGGVPEAAISQKEIVGGVPAEPQPEHGLFTEACGGCSSALCVVDGCRKVGQQ